MRKKTVEAFGATSTTEEVLTGVNLHGKRILVTGVSAGIGVETARSLSAPLTSLDPVSQPSPTPHFSPTPKDAT
jgi:hypothetical protein